MYRRLATDVDIEKIVSITHETIIEIYPRYYPKGAVAFFLALHNAEKIAADIALGRVFVLLEENTPVGTVTIKDSEICRLFVLPKQQKKGFGKALMEFAEKNIFKISHKVELAASLPAKQFYIQRGYVEIEYQTLLTENGDYLCYDLMEKMAPVLS